MLDEAINESSSVLCSFDPCLVVCGCSVLRLTLTVIAEDIVIV
jgi:hypothetical protein